MTSRLLFHGAAGTVTGSATVIEHEGHRVLVDCGLFQGSKTVKELNYRPFPFPAATIEAVLLTHAHVDHCGLLPKLARDGFSGRVIATSGTRDLLTCVLPDCGAIQEMEVEHLNRRRQQRGEPTVAPIYTRADAEALLPRVDAAAWNRWVEPVPGIRARYWPAAHILGSASIEIELAREGAEPLRLLFSGDLGPGDKALHGSAEGPAGVDYLVVESTYGDRERRHLGPEQRRAALLAEVEAAIAAGGNLVIPAFAVERTQELLFDLGACFAAGKLPGVHVFLDSPLAVQATEVFVAHADELGEAARLPHPFEDPRFHFVEDVAGSKALNRLRSGAIILAASGMCDAGRIRFHLKSNLWRPESTVLLVGYQAPGTLGRLLQDGAGAVRIQGEEIRVGARIRSLDLYSAHADRRQLVEWVQRRMPVRRAILLNHGEPQSMAGLAAALAERLTGLPPLLEPMLDSILDLEAAPPRLQPLAPRVAPEALAALDWHNAYAAFVLGLAEQLRTAPDERARQLLLHRLTAALHARA
ncbi:MAG TPA: MBL fold metallo-hydrolase [Stellaceae bacterium]|nr:MBL fold metallo-hydrolase [Stellaceae bacterium]